MVARARADVGVPGHHVVVARRVRGEDVVHRIVVAQRAVHRERIGPAFGAYRSWNTAGAHETHVLSCLINTTKQTECQDWLLSRFYGRGAGSADVLGDNDRSYTNLRTRLR